MRGKAYRLTCVLFGLAACGGGGGNGDGGGGDDAPPTADAPPADQPLDERLVVATVAAPDGVMPGRSNWRIWGTGNLRISPVFTVPYADCGTLVGYTTGTAGAPMARVARLDASDQLVATYDVGAYELRGLAAEPDGHFAALLWDDAPDPAVLTVARFDAAGAPGWATPLVDPLAAPTDFGIGESRLEYGDGRYGAYFHVHGISDWATGHEGDALKWVDAASGDMSNGWSWGCSHSMSELLRHDPTVNQFLAVCVTDCYPGTSGEFSTNSIGGVYLQHQRNVIDVDAGCNGSVAGELGSAAPTGAGWKLVFNAHQQPATLGQSSYSPATMDQDIGFASITGDRMPMGGVTWLTTTPAIDEHNASVAAWRPAGDAAEQYVVGWSEPGSPQSYKLVRVDASGATLGAVVDITGRAAWGERDDPFRDHRNGDIVWAWFDSAGSTELHLARIRSGGTGQCTSL